MQINNIDNESLLLKRLTQGDRIAFEILYNHYKKPLGLRILRLIHDKNLTQDIMQDLFLRIWNNRANIDCQQPFGAYINRISQNLVIDYYRKASRDKNLQEALWVSSLKKYANLEGALYEKEQQQIINNLIDNLPPQQKKAFILHRLEGKSHKEIADLLQVSLSTVNKHIYYAHQYIREQLQKYPEYTKVIAVCFITYFL